MESEEKVVKQSVLKTINKEVSKQQQPGSKKQVHFDLSTNDNPEAEEENGEDDLVLLTYQPKPNKTREETSVIEEEVELEEMEQANDQEGKEVEPREVGMEVIEDDEPETEEPETDAPEVEVQVEQEELEQEVELEELGESNVEEGSLSVENTDENTAVDYDGPSSSEVTEDDASEEDEEISTVRRSARQRKPAQYFTIPTIGGNPEMVAKNSFSFGLIASDKS